MASGARARVPDEEDGEMARWLFAQRRIPGRPAVVEQRLIDDLRPLRQAATGVEVTEPAGDGSFVIDLPGRFLRMDLHKRVRVHIAAHSRTSTLLSIPLRWQADPASAAFPTFEGTLEYERASRDHGTLMLVGRYQGPLGPLGTVGDALATSAVADRTAAALVKRLVAELRAGQRDGTVIGTVTTLGMHVRDVMSTDPVTFDEETPLQTAALVLLRARISGAPVVGASGKLVGVLSERDLLDKEAAPAGGWVRAEGVTRRRQRARTVGEACTRPALITAPDSTLRDAATEMARHGVSRLVVLDGARIVGIVSRHDVLRALVRTDDELEAAVREVLGPDAARLEEIRVDDGVVLLRGTAPTWGEALAWVGAAQSVDGIIDVDNRVAWEQEPVAPPVVF